jgi:hypothetical protein
MYHTIKLATFIYNVIGYVDNAANSIVLHVNILFGIQLVNLLLLSYTQGQWPEVINQPSH